jgi:hypothetical protein
LPNARDYSSEEWAAKAEEIHGNTQAGEMRGACFDSDGNLMGGISWQFGEDGSIQHGTHFDARRNTRISYGEKTPTHETDQTKGRDDPDRHAQGSYRTPSAWKFHGPEDAKEEAAYRAEMEAFNRAEYDRIRGLEK